MDDKPPAVPDTADIRGRRGIMKRLATEDRYEMTAAANRSPNHVSSNERWFNKAREADPALDDEQAARVGEMLRTEHYRRMGRLSAEARNLTR
jgi:hypothetical protein